MAEEYVSLLHNTIYTEQYPPLKAVKVQAPLSRLASQRPLPKKKCSTSSPTVTSKVTYPPDARQKYGGIAAGDKHGGAVPWRTDGEGGVAVFY